MIIKFKALNASCSEEYGGSFVDIIDNPDEPITKPKSETHLIYKISSTDSLTLATGEKLAEMRGVLRLTPNADPRDDQKSIGGMSYRGEREPYVISLELPKAQFDNLLEAARFGLIPSQIMIEFRRKFISDNIWNNESEYNRPGVVSVDFYIPLAGTRLQEESEKQLHDDLLPPTRLQTRLLTQLAHKASQKLFG